MSLTAKHSLRDDHGQAFVFVALSLGVLVAAVALVVDVGNWFQAKRHAQSVADAAALAAAPQLLDNPPTVVEDIARTSAQQNWANVQVTPTVSGKSVQVVTEPPLGSNLSPFGHFAISINASATAAIQVPTEVDAVAPIAIVCTLCSGGPPGPWSANPWHDGSSVPVSYTPGSPGVPSNGFFSPVQLQGVSTGNFSNFVTCDAGDPTSSSCNQSSMTAPVDVQALCLRFVRRGRPRRRVCSDTNQVANALSRGVDPSGTELHLVAIASGYSGGSFQVVGWAAAAFTDVTVNGSEVDLTLSFHSLLVDGKWLRAGASGNQYDFGVRAIALTG